VIFLIITSTFIGRWSIICEVSYFINMSSKVDQPLEKSTSLPALSERQKSLVALTQPSPNVTPRQKASQWAFEIRRR